MGKEVGYRIRVEPELRQAFIDACRNLDKPAAQVIREYMREFVEKNNTPQRDFFIKGNTEKL